MKTRVYPARLKNPPEEWKRKFAWRPKKIRLGPQVSPEWHRPYVWLWLSFYEYKSRDGDKVWPWLYRLGEGSCSSSSDKPQEEKETK